MAKEVEKIETSLYNGKVTVVFTPGNHAYKINGERVVGVTTALGIIDKPALIGWAVNLMKNHLLGLLHGDNFGNITAEEILTAAKLHLERKKDTANTGTLVHEWAESYIKGLNPAMPEDQRVVQGVTAFLGWVKEYEVKFIASEKMVYSRRYNYVGTMDCIFTMGREDHKIKHVGDFKTGGAIYDEYRFQVAAYEEADAEESGAVYGEKWLMRFAKEDKLDKTTGDIKEKAGTFEAVAFSPDEHQADLEAFLAAKTIYERKRALEKQKA